MEANDDEFAIRRAIEQWAVWRDAGEWDRFVQLWTADARMVATWFEGPAAEFIRRSKAGWERGVNVTHMLGGTAIEIRDGRCVAQTKMSITQRASLHGSTVDVVCMGRFYDFFAFDGRWLLAVRQCIYENDRLETIAGSPVVIPEEELDRFPQGYRHLAYLQGQSGMQVATDRPGRTGAALQALYNCGRDWLAGGQPPLAAAHAVRDAE